MQPHARRARAAVKRKHQRAPHASPRIIARVSDKKYLRLGLARLRVADRHIPGRNRVTESHAVGAARRMPRYRSRLVQHIRDARGRSRSRGRGTSRGLC